MRHVKYRVVEKGDQIRLTKEGYGDTVYTVVEAHYPDWWLANAQYLRISHARQEFEVWVSCRYENRQSPKETIPRLEIVP